MITDVRRDGIALPRSFLLNQKVSSLEQGSIDPLSFCHFWMQLQPWEIGIEVRGYKWRIIRYLASNLNVPEHTVKNWTGERFDFSGCPPWAHRAIAAIHCLGIQGLKESIHCAA